jgi:DNA-binding NarL/FixJ family response regulator
VSPARSLAASVRLGIVVRSALVRDALRHFLGADPRFDIVGQEESLSRALDLVRRHEPEVLLLGLAEEGHDPLEVVLQIQALGRGTRIVVLALDGRDEQAVRLLRAGARGLVPPHAGAAEVAEALGVVGRGGLYLEPELQRLCAERYLVDAGGRGACDSLSHREFQVLRLLALGHTNREIASRLHLSVKTVDTHRTHVLHKLGLRNNADLARFAIRHRLVAVEPPAPREPAAGGSEEFLAEFEPPPDSPAPGLGSSLAAGPRATRATEG